MKHRSRLMFGIVLITVLAYLYYLYTRGHDVMRFSVPHKMVSQTDLRDTWPPRGTSRDHVMSLADRYCNRLEVPLSGTEGLAPAGFRLEQVQLLIRHGDRAPMHSPTKHQPQYRISCHMDSAHKSAHAQQYLYHLNKYAKLRPRSAFRTVSMYPNKKYCDMAQMTPVGVEQHLKLGRFLKKTYVDKLKLLKPVFDSSEMVLKSTKYSRTYQSASAFLFGFLPDYNVSKLRMSEASISFCDAKIHTCNCALYSTFFTKVTDRLVYNHSKEVEGVFNKFIKPTFPALKITHYRGTIDGLTGPYCHSIPLCKKCNETSVLEHAWAIDHHMRGKLNKNLTYQKLHRLYMQPFLLELATRMRDRTQTLGGNQKRFALFSGHDVTITSMIVALGLSDDLWPPYASRIAFELYKNAGDDGYYFRVVYNGKDVTGEVRFCRDVKQGELCPLENFLEFVSRTNFLDLGGNTYSQVCNGRLDAPPVR